MSWDAVSLVEEREIAPSQVDAPCPETASKASDLAVRSLESSELLFAAGDARTHVFRVESGAVCLYDSHKPDRQSAIEFIFPGDYAGLGFLEKHTVTAR